MGNQGYSSQPKRSKFIDIKVPENFNVLDNSGVVFQFVKELMSLKNDRRIYQVYFDLSDVTFIDSVGACLLVSLVKELGCSNIRVAGNLPNDEQCAKIISDSGFLNHMKDAKGHKFEVQTSNFIQETGTCRTKNADIASAIRCAMKMLYGEEKRFRPCYTVAMEICSNSVEHAYHQRPKHWRLGIYHEGDKVIFTMIDTGVGILSTIKRKFLHEIKDAVTLKSNAAILFRAFQRKYGSSTEDVNRNKGLPCILDKFESKYIKNLKVITNDVYLDFNHPSENNRLNNKFSGVLFYWEVDRECVDKFFIDNNNSIVV